MLHLQGEANRYILKIIPLFSHSRFRLRVCPSAGGRWEMAMKGMTSCSFVFTAPCAVDSYSISTGICTPNYYYYNLTESFTNKRIIRYLYRKFRDESTPTLRCDCKGGSAWSDQDPFCVTGAVRMVGQPGNPSTQFKGVQL